MALLTIGGSLPVGGLWTVSASSLEGVADPILSTNASTPEPYGVAHPVLDISKQMATWGSAEAGGIDTLIANGDVDAATSWITSTTLPGDFWKAITPDASDTFYTGKQYRMRWTGAGTMVLGSGGTTDSTAANEVVFTADGGFLQVRATSGPISGLSIVDVNHTARYDAGERIDPEYAALVADMRQIRFMDWNYTNNSTQTNWTSRPVPSQNSYSEANFGDSTVSRQGVPLELMVELCNRTKADMWFCYPHAADDTYITNAATYVRDNLNTDLICTYEMSNETWNFGSAFADQKAHFLTLGQTLWPDAVGSEDPSIIEQSALGYRTRQAAQLIDTVYSGILSRRQIAINVQADFVAYGVAALDAPVWQTYAGNGNSTSGAYVAPYTAITHLATTSYFGTGLLNATRMAAIEAAYPATSDALIDGYLRETGATGQEILSIDAVDNYWSEYNAIAAARGIGMLHYEGGPHMVMQTGTQTQTARDACNQWMGSSLGVTFCNDLINQWQARSEATGPFMQFQDVGTWSEFGSWTIWEHMGSTPSGYMAQLLTENTNGSNWWGDTTDHRHEAI